MGDYSTFSSSQQKSERRCTTEQAQLLLTSPSVQFSVVFDFDHTIVDKDSYTTIAAHLGLATQLTALIEEKKANRLVSNDDPDGFEWQTMYSELLKGTPVSTFTAAIDAAIPLIEGMEHVFALLSSDPALFKVFVASDSNQLVVQHFMRTRLPNVTLSSVFSNPVVTAISPTSSYDADGCCNNSNNKAVEEVLHRIDWYYPEGSGCKLCDSPNLCKTRVLKEQSIIVVPDNSNTVSRPSSAGQSKSESSDGITSRVIYCGDGGNDFCPILNLAEDDFAFVRSGLVLEKRVKQNREKIRCLNVHFWRTGNDLVKLVEMAMSMMNCSSHDSLANSSTSTRSDSCTC